MILHWHFITSIANKSH